MGWTSYNAQYYKNGTVDRKKECDEYWEGGLNRGHFKVLKSTMVGSTYYAAVKILKSFYYFIKIRPRVIVTTGTHTAAHIMQQ